MVKLNKIKYKVQGKCMRRKVQGEKDEENKLQEGGKEVIEGVCWLGRRNGRRKNIMINGIINNKIRLK